MLYKKKLLYVLFCFVAFPLYAEPNNMNFSNYISTLDLGKYVILTDEGKRVDALQQTDLQAINLQQSQIWQDFRSMLHGDTIVSIPVGAIMPSDFKKYSILAPRSPNPTNNNIFYFSPQTINVLGENQKIYGRSFIDTDNDTTISPFNGAINIEKHTEKAQSSRPIVRIVYENSSSNIDRYGGGGMFSKLPPVMINSYQTPSGYGSLTGISLWLLDQSRGEKAPLLNQSQIFDGTLIRDGRSSTWGISLSQRDTTGVSPQPFSETFAELDGSGNGPDAGHPSFLPGDGNRKGIWIQSGSENFHVKGIGKNSNLVENSIWQPSRFFQRDDRIRVIALDGRFHLYSACNDGETGNKKPEWSIDENKTISDGTVNWKHLGLFNAGFSKAIFIDGNNYFGTGDSWFDIGITSNDNFSGAFIDTSAAHFINPEKSFVLKKDQNGNPIPDGTGSFKYSYVPSVYGAALRMAANQNIDFSANGTKEGLNNRRLTYNSSDAALEYINTSGNVLDIYDNGEFDVVGPIFVKDNKINYLDKTRDYSNNNIIMGQGFWSKEKNDTDILSAQKSLILGTLAGKSGTISHPALEINDKNVTIFHDIMQIVSMSEKNILSIPHPNEGMIVNDSNRHVPVIYEMHAWRPIQLGRPL